ncbi:hypothetical protein SLV14_003828 [Streptomyces sp. Je 1-4]|uniref:hypothetical protein n=1 Tax=Streptomyces TaxID=1883 RepID=UPI0021D9A9CD|nr:MULTISPECIES: hypothetical protein [unclassified Streptomyces]UYB41130.1 hypothetical protein SLV14_003828 [Streptomyces sp. Je 1-4]UZQ37300.1 hypothetical protein SLV14N_003828 [Streptomyces sp. Je 1-4] [Streptomyces sp. Je 1-4 4N24]UZQ44717.1 hypothetical protein SLV14NA_003828 [Streptomyces sp. Je 1-4] [Streptomyces sp. Je 1-4 4N24_ara]
MQNLMRSLLARLRKRRTRPAPTVTYRPQWPRHRPLPLHRPESPLDGEATLLVRPYLLAHERQEARREEAFLREMAVAS